MAQGARICRIGAALSGLALCIAAAPADAPPPEKAPADVILQAAPVQADVTVSDAQLRGAAGDAANWLLHGRTYDNQRFSPLTQVSRANVNRLTPVALIQTGVANSFETTPLVVNGVMFVSTPGDHVLAYDAASGAPLWSYAPALNFSDLCCGPQSRGVAVAYGKVFVAQLDATVVALDARSGQVVWKSDPATTLPSDPAFYSYTLAPQVYDGMVIVGSSGAEYPSRGFVQAYDAGTGKLIWRFRTTAAPAEPGGDSWGGNSWEHGGGSVWNTPAIDPERKLVSFAVGNPNPDLDGHSRPGDNAYTNSIVGLDVRSGKLAWWYQEVPHDVWDYDAAAPVIFLNVKDANGKTVPAAAEAGKVGNVFIVDRTNGKLLRKSDPFVLQSSTMTHRPDDTPTLIYPAADGGSTWSPAAYSPRTHDFYVMGVNQAAVYSIKQVEPYVPGTPVVGQVMGGKLNFIIDGKAQGTFSPSGNLSAVNVDTGKIAWQQATEFPMIGGVMATASDLVFTGEQDGNFDAFDARNGKKLWSFNLGAGVSGPPVTYSVKGRQYVAVAAGGLSANGHPRLLASRGRTAFGDVIAIFALPAGKKPS
jgi:PQQ-dependent dehydrogenase (methanol/ethanol family)